VPKVSYDRTVREQFRAKPSFEANAEFPVHAFSLVSTASQADEQPFDAAVHFARSQLKNAQRAAGLSLPNSFCADRPLLMLGLSEHYVAPPDLV
jgi:hypothetical protein